MRRAPIKTQTLQVLVDRGIPVQTILDVGVLNGTPELTAAFPRTRQVLFEPVAEFATAIRGGYAGHNFKLVQAAVGARDGKARLATVSIKNDDEISHSHFAADDQAGRDVTLVSLDGYLDLEPEIGPFLLKIDVDGAELEVLAGASRTLRECSVVVIEVPRTEFVERIKVVSDAGFTLFDLSEPCYYDGAFWQCDAVFVRNDLYERHFKSLQHHDFDPGSYVAFVG